MKYFYALLEKILPVIQLVLKSATSLFGLFGYSYSTIIQFVFRGMWKERKAVCFLFSFLIYQLFG